MIHHSSQPANKKANAVRHQTSLRWHYPVQVQRVFLSLHVEGHPESFYSLQHKEPPQRKQVTPARSILAPVTLRMIPINSCDGKNRLNAAGYKYTFFEVGNISALRGYYFH
jgi:hypothetical protein